MKKSDCVGCYKDFYNGNNDLGVRECWHFKFANLVKRVPVGFLESPPYDLELVEVPSCYKDKRRGGERILYIKREALTDAGYWK